MGYQKQKAPKITKVAVQSQMPSIGGEWDVEALGEYVVEHGNAAVQALLAARGTQSLPDPIDVANADQGDGQQVIVADTGNDMDAWSGLTGQEQVEDGGGLDGAVDQVIENANGEPIDSVEFKSHGWANRQEVADGTSGMLRNPLTQQQRDAFARLGEAMSPDGIILLAGCNVAQNFEQNVEAGVSVMLQVAVAAQRTVKAGVAVQLPLDGIEGTEVTVNPDGSYVIDTSTGAQIYDVTADGLMGLVHDVANADSFGEAAGDVAETAGDMAEGYWDTAVDWWNS